MSMQYGGSNITFSDGSTQNTAPSGFGFKNRIINGAMMIDQRNAGASVAIGSGAYPVDRFGAIMNAGTGNTAQRSATAPSGFVNSTLITVGTGAAPTSAQVGMFYQIIEGLNLADLAWGTSSAQSVTLSFWVRSSLTGAFGCGIKNYSGTRAYTASYTISAANTWQQVSVTIPGDTTGTWVTDNTGGPYIAFDIGEGSTRSQAAGSWTAGNTIGLTSGTKLCATSGATFYITGVQLEKGSTATAFDYRSYGSELMLCQRYYEVLNGFNGYGFSATSTVAGNLAYIVKRATPTIGVTGALQVTSYGVGSNTQTSANAGIQGATPNCAYFSFGNFSGITNGVMFYNHIPNSNNITVSAEL